MKGLEPKFGYFAAKAPAKVEVTEETESEKAQKDVTSGNIMELLEFNMEPENHGVDTVLDVVSLWFLQTFGKQTETSNPTCICTDREAPCRGSITERWEAETFS